MHRSPGPRRPRAALLFAALLGCAPAIASPTISWIYPAGARRGTTTTLEVHGSGLKEIAGLFSTGAGITAEVAPLPAKKGGSKDAGDSDSVRTLRITVAPDAPLGLREARVFDHSGVSNPKMFQIGQWPEITETEPNDSLDGLKPIAVPVTINGRIQNGSDQDCFRFAAKAGQQIVCEVYSERLLSMFDDSWLKGYLEVLDAAGKTVADSPGRFHWDPVVQFTAPADGDYVVRFRDLLWRGSESAVYRMTVGPIPYADALFPPGGRRGAVVQAAFTGINLGPQPVEAIPVTFDEANGVREVRLAAPGGMTNPMVFQEGDVPETLEREPNDRDDLAQPVAMPTTINGRIEREGDRDCFRFHVTSRERYVFEVFANRAGSPLDPYLTLRDSKGKVLEEDDDSRDRDSLIDRTLDKDADYVVEVRDSGDRGGPDFTYRLRIGPPVPDYRLVATPDRLGVPAGGVVRIDVKVDRRWGFDAPIALSVEGLPAGWRASPPTLRPGSDRALLTLAAPAAGAAGPVQVRIVGVARLAGHAFRRAAMAEETYNLQGTAYQRQVVGPIAVAADPAAVSVQPGAAEIALKAGDKTSLSVRVTRASGVKGPITLKIDGLPEGVTADPVEAAADKDEGIVTIQAAETAPAAEADIVVTGALKAADGKTSDALSLALPIRVAEVPSFRLDVDPAEPTLDPGKTATLTIKATRRGGFDGPIALQVSGLPAGVAADPIEIKKGQNEAKLTLKAAKKLPDGTAGRSFDLHVDGTATVGADKRTRSAGTVKLAVGK